MLSKKAFKDRKQGIFQRIRARIWYNKNGQESPGKGHT